MNLAIYDENIGYWVHRGAPTDWVTEHIASFMHGTSSTIDRLAKGRNVFKGCTSTCAEIEDCVGEVGLENKIKLLLTDDWTLPDRDEVASFLMGPALQYADRFSQTMICGFRQEGKMNVVTVLRRMGFSNPAEFMLLDLSEKAVTDDFGVLLVRERVQK